MPRPVTKATASEAVLAATRGPDDENNLLKSTTTAVIRYWITDWEYGDIVGLPFVAFDVPKSSDFSVIGHFAAHVLTAAEVLQLPVIWKVPTAALEGSRYYFATGIPHLGNYRMWARRWINAFPGARELCKP